MSEEEKKAFSRLYMKATLYSADAEDYPNSIVSKRDLVIIINLIEKQQKEIETYKLLNANIEKDNKRQSIAIIEYQDLLENSISKDKIREKIKEIERKSFENKINYSEYYYKTEILKELLKEK